MLFARGRVVLIQLGFKVAYDTGRLILIIILIKSYYNFFYFHPTQVKVQQRKDKYIYTFFILHLVTQVKVQQRKENSLERRLDKKVKKKMKKAMHHRVKVKIAK